MLQFLTEPYPSQRSFRQDFLVAMGSGLFVGWFLNTFQPGETYTWQDPNKDLFLWGYGIVVFVMLMLLRALVPALFPGLFREAQWTVGKHILYVLLSFLLTILACFFYHAWYLTLPFRWSNLLAFTTISSTIAVFPLSGLVLLDYIRRLKKYQSGAQRVSLSAKKETNPQPELISLCDEQDQVQLKVDATAILYLQSAANYVEIFYLQDGQIKKELIRNTLKAMGAQLPAGQFQQAHRSYLVQLAKVVEVTDNAQGYKLHFAEAVDPVPVSRSRSQATLAALEA
jgi:hypothetical protein